MVKKEKHWIKGVPLWLCNLHKVAYFDGRILGADSVLLPCCTVASAEKRRRIKEIEEQEEAKRFYGIRN